MSRINMLLLIMVTLITVHGFAGSTANAQGHPIEKPRGRIAGDCPGPGCLSQIVGPPKGDETAPSPGSTTVTKSTGAGSILGQAQPVGSPPIASSANSSGSGTGSNSCAYQMYSVEPFGAITCFSWCRYFPPLFLVSILCCANVRRRARRRSRRQ